MKFTPKQYAQALYDSLQDTNPKEVDLVLSNFVDVLIANSDIKMFPEVENEFHKIDLEAKGKKQVEITTAHPLSRENERNILDELNRIVKGDLEIKKKIDEKILGGVIINIDDQRLDASVKTNLEELKKDLSE